MYPTQNNLDWLPRYCDPRTFLPGVQETVVLFDQPPLLFQDFVGKAIAWLQSSEVEAMGFRYDPRTALPCKWKCSDESLFGVDLCLYAYTGHYPFDKGKIGGKFNDGAVGAAVHHSAQNVDFGGAHVGYAPGDGGGTFGRIERPLRESEVSTDCGYMMGVLAPFQEVYTDACRNIFLWSPDGQRVLASVPNEYLEPSWSSRRIKLLVDLSRFAAGVVPYEVKKPYTHKLAGRTLFFVAETFLTQLDPAVAARFVTPDPTPVGRELTAEFFNIFDSGAELANGIPVEGILPYMKYILSSRVAPDALKAAVTSANIEHNRLVDTVRAEPFRAFSFACFSGVFIDMFDERVGAYVNLFQPIGAAIKPAGRSREIEISPAEVHAKLAPLTPATPRFPLESVLGYPRPTDLVERFTYPTSRTVR